MRVYLDFVNCLKIVENEEIKMVYLIVVLFSCVLSVSGMFQAIYEFRPLEGIKPWPNGLASFGLAFNLRFVWPPICVDLHHTKSYKSHPKLGPPMPLTGRTKIP